MFPLTVNVPPVPIVITCLWPPPELVYAILPAFKMPAPIATVLVVVVGLGIVKVPAIFNVIPVLMLTVELVVAVERKLKEAQFAVISTATTTPLLIVRASERVGVVADPATPFAVAAQIEPLQLPEVTANF